MRIPGGKSCYARQNVILNRTGTNLCLAMTAPEVKRLSRKPSWHGNYAKVINRLHAATSPLSAGFSLEAAHNEAHKTLDLG
jgi:hypothetical protein